MINTKYGKGRDLLMAKILIIDDDIAISELMGDVLEDEGYETQIENSSLSAFARIDAGEVFSLILLDVMMPDLDGFSLCRKIREKVSCPIIFVTAKNRTLDTVLGLEVGGDDYIYKPFEVDELIARVRANLRQSERIQSSPPANVITIGDIVLNAERYEVTKNGKKTELTTREFQLLEMLMRNAGIVLTREQIFNAVWGLDYGDIGTVAVNIKNLRTKIDPDGNYIKTVWGVGYKFVNE